MTLTQQRTSPARRRYVLPAAGTALAAAGTVGAIALADAATESDGLAAFDPGFTADAVAARREPLTSLAHALTFIGSVPVLVALMLVAAVLLWRWTGTLRAPGLLLFAMAGSAALTYVLKLLVERKRPGITFVLGPVDNGYAFPSGHTLNSTVFFGMLAGLMWASLRSSRARTAVGLTATVLSLGIGLSRVYLGYHWATDVLAGWAIAVTWLTIVAAVAYFTRDLVRPRGL
ncbi:phosphatase PAP2 family protein [Kribbella sp. NPDC051718]|uniref:phosphatase PAP2 family protein n=1 Tax=Kribbella sp. NPDC051718 TaxID=3155168 RepID=UPI00343F815B